MENDIEDEEVIENLDEEYLYDWEAPIYDLKQLIHQLGQPIH